MSRMKKKLRTLERVKDSLRDDLDDIKILVRRSFGTISTELVDLEDTIVQGCAALQEEAILRRILGADGSSKNSIGAVFQYIDTIHASLEQAGVRRRRNNGVSSRGDAAGGEDVTDPACARNVSQDTVSSSTDQLACPQTPDTRDLLATVPCADADGIEPWLPPKDDARADSHLPPGPSANSDAVASTSAASPSVESFSRRRNVCFSSGDLFGVSSFALQQSCQQRLATLSCLRDEMLVGALNAQRKLVAAKRWVPDAPNPLAASVEGLLAEVHAMKRQLLTESPSVSMASLPMVQYPLASINIKQMKVHLQQASHNNGRVSPRHTGSPGRVPTLSHPQKELEAMSFLQASKTGSSLIEGSIAQDAFSQRIHTITGIQKTRMRKVLESGAQRKPLLVAPEPPITDSQFLKEQPLMHSDDIQRLLRAVKAEIQVQSKPVQGNTSKPQAARRTPMPRSSTSSIFNSPAEAWDMKPSQRPPFGSRLETPASTLPSVTPSRAVSPPLGQLQQRSFSSMS